MSIRYISELDGLRAIAAITVVAFHVRLPGVLGGFLGVDVFFVLSGYLTASIALSGRYTFFEFMGRRLCRLWPLLLCVSAAVAFFLPAGASVWREVLPGILFLGNLSVILFGTPEIMIHTWTLGAEMQFYAVLAVLVFVAPGVATFRVIAAGLFLSVTAARLGYSHGENWQHGFYSPLAHSSGLFLGAFLATLPIERVRGASALFVSSIAAVLTTFALAEFHTAATLSFWITMAEIATAGLIVSIVSGVGVLGAALRMPVMRTLGVWSFGIYLWHYPIAVIAQASLSPGLAFIATLTASVLLAALTYHLVEKPTRAAGRHRLRAPRAIL